MAVASSDHSGSHVLKPRRVDYRPHAVFLVAASAAVLLFVSMVLQLAVWESHHYYRLHGPALPEPAKTFFDMFGHRPDCYVVGVVFWVWWPMVAALLYCHFRHRSARAFAVAFLYWFACCWLLAASILAFTAMMCSYPQLGLLLADVDESPGYMSMASAISWALPALVAVFGIACWRYFRRRTNDESECEIAPKQTVNRVQEM